MKKFLSAVLAGLLALSPATSTANAAEVEFITPETIFQRERIRMWQLDLEYFRLRLSQAHGMFWDDTEIFIPADILGLDEGQFGVWMDLERNQAIRENAINAIDDLIEELPYLSDAEIIIGLQRAIAIMQDSHFQLMPTEIYYADAHLPLDFLHLGGHSGGYYLISTTQEFAHILNHRLVSINGVPVSEIETRFGELVATENIYALRQHASLSVFHSDFMLNALGLREDGASTFVLESSEGNRVELTFDESHARSFEDSGGASRRFIPDDALAPFMPAQERIDGDVPIFFEDHGANRFYFLEDYGILYIRLEGYSPTVLVGIQYWMYDNGIDDWDVLNDFEAEFREKMATGEFMGVIWPSEDYYIIEAYFYDAFVPHPGIIEIIENNTLNAVIIDARGNGGGDHSPFVPLFQLLLDSVPEGMVFYFSNGGAASASIMSGMLLHYMGATFIGEPIGQNTIFYGMGQWEGMADEIYPDVRLNYTGIEITIPNLFAHIGTDFMQFEGVGFTAASFLAVTPNFEFYTFRPRVLIEHTIEHWVNNIGPLLEYVISRIVGAN